MRYFTIMSSTSKRTIEWGRVYASSQEGALSVANRDNAKLLAVSGIMNTVTGDKPVESPHLWVKDGCVDCDGTAEYEAVNGDPVCANCFTSDRAKGV